MATWSTCEWVPGIFCWSVARTCCTRSLSPMAGTLTNDRRFSLSRKWDKAKVITLVITFVFLSMYSFLYCRMSNVHRLSQYKVSGIRYRLKCSYVATIHNNYVLIIGKRFSQWSLSILCTFHKCALRPAYFSAWPFIYPFTHLTIYIKTIYCDCWALFSRFSYLCLVHLSNYLPICF